MIQPHFILYWRLSPMHPLQYKGGAFPNKFLHKNELAALAQVMLVDRLHAVVVPCNPCSSALAYQLDT
jgi:hypothetical protein